MSPLGMHAACTAQQDYMFVATWAMLMQLIVARPGKSESPMGGSLN